MLIAEIKLTHPDLVLTDTIEALPDVSIDLDYQTITPSGDYYLFFEVSDGDYDAFDAAVADDPTVEDSTVIIQSETFRVYRMRLRKVDKLVLPRASELGLRVLRGWAEGGGWKASLEVPDLDQLQKFRSYCTDRDIQFSVLRLYRSEENGSGEFGLTAPQREALVTAYSNGYFDEPRDASLQDVADELGISPSAASGRLRRGISALLGNTVAVDET